MGNSVGWFEIYVDDLERATKFYETVFAIKFEALSDMDEPGFKMMAFPSDMEAYGAPGVLVKMDGFGPGVGGSLVYFSCDDCAVEEGRVAVGGGKVDKAKYSIGEYGFVSMIIDSEGNMIGLHSLK